PRVSSRAADLTSHPVAPALTAARTSSPAPLADSMSTWGGSSSASRAAVRSTPVVSGRFRSTTATVGRAAGAIRNTLAPSPAVPPTFIPASSTARATASRHIGSSSTTRTRISSLFMQKILGGLRRTRLGCHGASVVEIELVQVQPAWCRDQLDRGPLGCAAARRLVHDAVATQDAIDLHLESGVLQGLACLLAAHSDHVGNIHLGGTARHGQGHGAVHAQTGAGVRELADHHTLIDVLTLLLDDLDLQIEVFQGGARIVQLLADHSGHGDTSADGECDAPLAVGGRSGLGVGLDHLTRWDLSGVDLLLDDVLGCEPEILQILGGVGDVLTDQVGHVHGLWTHRQKDSHAVAGGES